VASGELSLADVTRGNGLARAYATASMTERIALGRAVGTARLWDEAIVPNLTSD
jgi:hypothetical protein